MKTNILTTLVAFFIVTSIFSQSNLNEYKYIIVPKQFSFLKEPDQYRINGLAEFLFNKYNFTAFMEGGNYPKDYFDDRCSALRADVLKEPGMFKSRLKIVLKDCNDQVVYTSPSGESREKDYGKAYNEALRNAFKVFETLNYKYAPSKKRPVLIPKEEQNSNNAAVVSEIQKLKEEIQILKEKKEFQVEKQVEVKSVSVLPQVEREVDIVEKKVKEQVSIEKNIIVKKNISGTLYAQETQNGYQLVDSTPKVIYKIKETGLNNVYIVDGINAVIYKKDNSWMIEYYEGNQLKNEALNIKF